MPKIDVIKQLACSSFVPGGICKSGFPLSLSSACNGRTCMCCNRPNDIVPPCQRDDLPQMWLGEDGWPWLLKREGK